MIHAYICLNSDCTQCVLSGDYEGLIDSPDLLYLLSRLNAIIDNPKEINNPDIVISEKGRIHKSKTIRNMINKGYKPFDIAYTTGINIKIIEPIVSREKRKNVIHR